MLNLPPPYPSSCYLLNSLWFLFFCKLYLTAGASFGKEPYVLLSVHYVPPHFFGLYLDYLSSPPLLPSLPFSSTRPQANLPSRCLTSWSGWAWSPSRWFGCLSSTGWLLQSRQSTRPNATSANSVPSRASGRYARQRDMHLDKIGHLTWDNSSAITFGSALLKIKHTQGKWLWLLHIPNLNRCCCASVLHRPSVFYWFSKVLVTIHIAFTSVPLLRHRQ